MLKAQPIVNCQLEHDQQLDEYTGKWEPQKLRSILPGMYSIYSGRLERIG
jgi:hypothetical protein